jgi:hypothetical protein
VVLVRVGPLHAVAALLAVSTWMADALAHPVQLPGGPEDGIALGHLAPALVPLLLPGLLRATWRVERHLAPQAARRLRLHVLALVGGGLGLHAAALHVGWLSSGSTLRSALGAALGVGVAGRWFEPIAPVGALALLAAGATVGVPSWMHPASPVPPSFLLVAVAAIAVSAASFLRAQTGPPPRRHRRRDRPTRSTSDPGGHL